MRRVLSIIVIFLFIGTAAEAAPARIVSLKSSITDVVYALGAGERLVGATRYCDIPPGYPKPAIAGDYTQPYTERIVALAPDIVMGSMENSSRRSIEQLERMGIRVELFPFTTVEETLASIRGIGVALGMPGDGEALAKKTADALASLRKKWSTLPPRRVVVIWGTRPLIVAGPGTYMDELVEYIGASNAVRKTKIKYPRLGLEELIALDPDAIVDLSMGSERQGTGIGGQGSGKDSRPWDGIDALSAVRNGRVISLETSLFRAGPNLPEGLAKLAEMLHESARYQNRAIVR